MPFLTLAGTTYEVLTEGAEESSAFGGMMEDFAFDGSLRADYTPEVRLFTFSLKPMTETDFQTLKTLAASGVVVCNGDALNNVAMNAVIMIRSRGYLADGATFWRMATIELIEAL